MNKSFFKQQETFWFLFKLKITKLSGMIIEVTYNRTVILFFDKWFTCWVMNDCYLRTSVFPFLRCRFLKFSWKPQLSKHFQRNLLNLSKNEKKIDYTVCLIRTSANLILLWEKMNLKFFHKTPILNMRTVLIRLTTLLGLNLKHVDYIAFITQKFIKKRFFILMISKTKNTSCYK